VDEQLERGGFAVCEAGPFGEAIEPSGCSLSMEELLAMEECSFKG
jgi:hypothetical protein